jgi:hypothetical protein
MLRFFSKIRYQLAAENKAGRYLRYTIGEILLVVIGILIALQVNNRNEQRKDRTQERNFLVRLEADVNTDIENIYNSIRSNKNRMQRAEFLMASVNHPQMAEDSATYFIQSIEYAGYTNNPVVSDNTFEEIKSSGKLSLIRNEKLRGAIQEYYSWPSDRGQYNFILQDNQLNYLHERRGILSPRQQINMGSFTPSEHYSPAEAKQVYARMIRKPGFLESLPFVIQTQVRTGESFEDIKKQATELKTMIERELNN